jgi:hypothetical protein
MDILNEGYKVFDNVLSGKLHAELNDFSKFYIERALKRQQKSGNIGYNLFRTESLQMDFPFGLVHNFVFYPVKINSHFA